MSAGAGARPRRRAAGSSVLADVRSALEKLTTPPVATLAAGVMLVLLLAVVAAHLASLREPSGGTFELGTGDFLAFRNGAAAIAADDGAHLYDFEAQQQRQAEILGGTAADFQPYLNPPLLAILLSPLAAASYVHAFYVFDVLCVAALVAGLVFLRRMTPSIAAFPYGVATLVLVIASWQPMLQTTFGGQNTPVTFALLAALGLALARDRDVAAGVVLGLLTYKPQYAAGIGLALLLAGRLRVLAIAAVVGIAHFALGAWWCGVRWPLDMLDFMRAYRPMELAENAATHFSWVRVADFLLPAPFDAIAGALGAAVVVALWWRLRSSARTDTAAWFAAAISGTMLASPHQQYYDAALLALPIALLVERSLRCARPPGLFARVALAAAYVGYPAWELAPSIGVQPLFVLLAAVFGWSIRSMLSSGPSRTGQVSFA